MKIIKETSLKRIIRYIEYKIVLVIYRMLLLPPLQILLLKVLGAKIGKNTIIENPSFYNLYVKGFSNLTIGDNAYIGQECLFDLANKINIGNNVTISARVNFTTHLNVGYSDHPLQKYYLRRDGDIIIKDGTFIGTNVIILDNVIIEENNFIGAFSLINKSTEKKSFYAGIPANKIRDIV